MGIRTAATRTGGSRFVRAILAAGVVAALAASVSGSSEARAADRAGLVAAAARASRHTDQQLTEVSCTGRSFCLAVGQFSEPGNHSARLAEAWNGKTWRIVRDPLGGTLARLTCGSPAFCLAARGEGGTLPEAVWNGRTWAALKHQPVLIPPHGGTAFPNINCGSAKMCMVISGTQVEEWNGSRWHDLPGTNACAQGPPPCGWDALTCATSASSNCMGFDFACATTECDGGPDTIGAAWNGRTWDLSVSLPFSTPNALACAGPSFCLLTGFPVGAAITHDPQSSNWQDITPDLTAICHGAADCTLANASPSCGSRAPAWPPVRQPGAAEPGPRPGLERHQLDHRTLRPGARPGPRGERPVLRKRGQLHGRRQLQALPPQHQEDHRRTLERLQMADHLDAQSLELRPAQSAGQRRWPASSAGWGGALVLMGPGNPRQGCFPAPGPARAR